MRLALSLAMLACGVGPVPDEFTTKSADGVALNGVVDSPDGHPLATVIMVSGTGQFDRDVRFGRSGTNRDLLFKDFSARLTRRGLRVVRYDRRGVRYGDAARPYEAAIASGITVATLRDDLAAVYDWTRSNKGLNAACVVLLGHSEGMAHIGRLAQTGRPAPALVAGFGALMESPKAVLKWQLTERDAYSLRQMDADHDGVTTNQEVEANWRKTPSAAFDNLSPFLNPTGRWDENAILAVQKAQVGIYEKQRDDLNAFSDTTPYPSADKPFASYGWWKSWYSDDVAIAQRLSSWSVPLLLFYGSNDSQTPPQTEIDYARRYLKGQVDARILPGLGHSLGEHPLFGPMQDRAADEFADALTHRISSICIRRVNGKRSSGDQL